MIISAFSALQMLHERTAAAVVEVYLYGTIKEEVTMRLAHT